jgi:hypothetical protein
MGDVSSTTFFAPRSRVPFEDIESPVYCVTADVDWASDWCLRDFLQFMETCGIPPTLFATHRSPLIDAFEQANPKQVALHPNFLPGSTHGGSWQSVIQHMCQLFPRAETFRSHSFFDHSLLQARFRELGFQYDSNLCLFLQRGIVPLHLGSGLVRFPVFWEDDSHWILTGGQWDVETYIDRFQTPGLKILNIHPFFWTANIPNASYYEEVKRYITSVSEQHIKRVRWHGHGVRSFCAELLQRLLNSGARFETLAAVYRFVGSAGSNR